MAMNSSREEEGVAIAGGWTPAAATSPTAVAPSPLRSHAFRALRHPGYRAYFVAQIVSFLGNWMHTVALGWLVYRLTESSLLLGTVTFASQLPVLILAPFAGVVADRSSLRKMVATTQSLLSAISFSLAWLTFTGNVGVDLILVLAVLGGIVNSFDMPARQTLLLELAGPADLPSAIALSSTAVNSARLIGPAVAGALVASVGEAVCFLVNGLTFLAPIAVALLVRPPHERKPGPKAPFLLSLREGIRYARTAPQTRSVLPLVAVASLVAFPYLPMLPVFARDILAGGPELLGWLNVAVGLGSVIGALAVASLVDRKRIAPRLALGLVTFGGGLVALGLSRSMWLSLTVLPVVGFGMLSMLSSANTIIQSDTPDEMRGRVMSLYTTVLTGFFPLGALLCGAAGEWIGVGPTVAIGGVVTVLSGIHFASRLPSLRAIGIGEGRRVS